ncbi:chromate transporter [Kyrpidia spormannii]|uniref:Chromate transporter subunit N n=2 Tax=Kyrpidia spormannii TaxID=2055160 RepID=A0ACA8Z4X8_9BACL|nr:chromate transporter [Kyrpidia spormannii]CAB3389442.1 chromate transporter subunit N [Kyrpidia spormannii]CAB3390168.1 chromate transporter subunit N [Kyrpidia spormannii]
MNRRGIYQEIAWAMIRTGLLGYGGGPSAIPLFRYEAVNRYRWLDDEEFAHVLAVANTLPGPIATKMAAYLGYRQAGFPGALFAVLIHIGPTTLAMVILLGLLAVFQRSEVVKGMIAAVNPVVGVMLGLMAYEFLQKAWRGLGRWVGSLFIVLAGVLLVGYDVNAAIVVVVFLAYGLVHFRLSEFLSARRRATRPPARDGRSQEIQPQTAQVSQTSD